VYLVAFANSVPDGEEAILFIGVANDGRITGVDNPEKKQRDVTRTAIDWCYPPIRHTIRVLEVNSQYILAIIVQASHNKPHFAGPAFIRIGSQSKDASEEEFGHLIATRNSKARRLLEAMRKGEQIIVFHWFMGRSNRAVGPAILHNCTVTECTPYYATFRPATGTPVSADFQQITLSRNMSNNLLQVDIDG
jgi:Putative DNA-binding domain